MVAPFTVRIPKKFLKTVTFTGAAGAGAVGTVALATVTGAVLFEHFACRCTTDLAGATATVEVGVSGNTAALIAQATATDIDDGDWWESATPKVGIAGGIADKVVEGNLIITVGTAAVSAGVLEFSGYWRPLSADGNVA